MWTNKQNRTALLTGFIILMAVSGVAFIVVLNHYNQQTIADLTETEENTLASSTLKKFSNIQFGFTLEYPKDWNLVIAKPRNQSKAVMSHQVLVGDEVFKATLQKLEQVDNTNYTSDMTLRVRDNPSQASIDEWRQSNRQKRYEQSKDCVEPVPFGCFSEEDLKEQGTLTSLSGLKAYTDTYFEFDSTKACIEVANQNYVYELCYTASNPNNPNFKMYEQEVSEILKSFIISN